jgi:membrane associated rhomboid family serine protease
VSVISSARVAGPFDITRIYHVARGFQYHGLVIIPIGHDQQIRGYPWVTISLIALCTLVQIYSTTATPSRTEIRDRLAEVEAASTPEEQEAAVARVEALLDRIPIWRFGYHTGSGADYRLVTSAFVHEGWWHLIGNMLFLWLAGSALEDRWGRGKFLAFYMVGAVAAAVTFDATYSGDPTILVGASGAIAAAMGAFLVYFARTRITLWYFLMYRTGTFQMAAYVALPLWLAEQVVMANLDQGGIATATAYSAHVGGFVFGLVIAGLASMLFPRSMRDDDDEDPDSDDRPPRASPQPDDRYRQCVEAIKKKDLTTLRTIASRVILDLARDKDHGRVLEIYRGIAGAGLKTFPLTDGAFVAAAAAADAQADGRLYIEIAEAMRAEHPGSAQVPKVLWRLAEIQRTAGREDAELATLKLLAERYPRHEHGAKAIKELAKRAI